MPAVSMTRGRAHKTCPSFPSSKQKRPRRAALLVMKRSALRARLTLLVHDNRTPGRGRHLHAMLLAAEVVGDIPIFGASRVRYAGTVLHVLRIRRSAVATDVGADRAARNCATDRGHIAAASAADLMAEDATENRTNHGARNIGFAAFLDHVLALDPAALLGRPDYGVDRRDVRFEQPLVIAPAVLVACQRLA